MLFGLLWEQLKGITPRLENRHTYLDCLAQLNSTMKWKTKKAHKANKLWLASALSLHIEFNHRTLVDRSAKISRREEDWTASKRKDHTQMGKTIIHRQRADDSIYRDVWEKRGQIVNQLLGSQMYHMLGFVMNYCTIKSSTSASIMAVAPLFWEACLSNFCLSLSDTMTMSVQYLKCANMRWLTARQQLIQFWIVLNNFHIM